MTTEIDALIAASKANATESARYEHDDPWISAAEGSKILGIAIPTWWVWLRKGWIPRPVKLGSLSRWPRSEIVAIRARAIATRSIEA